MNVAIWAQKVDGAGNNIDPYVGTWVYQSNDTIFKIVFQKGRKISRYAETHGLYGGYYLSVKGEVLEDYMLESENFHYPSGQYVYLGT